MWFLVNLELWVLYKFLPIFEVGQWRGHLNVNIMYLAENKLALTKCFKIRGLMIIEAFAFLLFVFIFCASTAERIHRLPISLYRWPVDSFCSTREFFSTMQAILWHAGNCTVMRRMNFTGNLMLADNTFAVRAVSNWN